MSSFRSDCLYRNLVERVVGYDSSVAIARAIYTTSFILHELAMKNTSIIMGISYSVALNLSLLISGIET